MFTGPLRVTRLLAPMHPNLPHMQLGSLVEAETHNFKTQKQLSRRCWTFLQLQLPPNQTKHPVSGLSDWQMTSAKLIDNDTVAFSCIRPDNKTWSFSQMQVP